MTLQGMATNLEVGSELNLVATLDVQQIARVCRELFSYIWI